MQKNSWRQPCARLAAKALAPLVAHYIRTQERRLLAYSQPLPAAMLPGLLPYFDSQFLAGVRQVIQSPLPVAEPPLRGFVSRLGFHYPSIREVGGITFGRVIAAPRPMDDNLLFHELVHVAQYAQLGIDRFAYEYVQGFLASGSYEGIPLEECAYALEARFALEPQPFSVAEAVREWR